GALAVVIIDAAIERSPPVASRVAGARPRGRGGLRRREPERRDQEPHVLRLVARRRRAGLRKTLPPPRLAGELREPALYRRLRPARPGVLLAPAQLAGAQRQQP